MTLTHNSNLYMQSHAVYTNNLLASPCKNILSHTEKSEHISELSQDYTQESTTQIH